MGNYKTDGTNQQEFIATGSALASFIVKEAIRCFKKVNITEVLEPCAGAGDLTKAIREHLSVDILQYDLFPQQDDIIQQDFLKLKLEHKEGRGCIMNPPFNKGIKFIYKAMESCDYCISITGMNSLINIDYNKYEFIEMYAIKKQPFKCGLKADIGIFVIKRKGL